MRNLVRIIAFILAFAISVGAEAGKRSGGFGGHGWGKSSHSSHVKLKKKKNTKKKFIAGAAGAGAASSAAADNQNSKNGNSSENISAQTNWANHNTLEDHFNRHGRDFNARNMHDYANKAQRFLSESKIKKYLTKKDTDGIRRIWDPKTNTFGSYSKDGKTKTFYKPDTKKNGYSTNQEYWDSQPGDYVE